WWKSGVKLPSLPSLPSFGRQASLLFFFSSTSKHHLKHHLHHYRKMIRGKAVVVGVGENAIFFHLHVIGDKYMVDPAVRALGIVEAVEGAVVGIDQIGHVIAVVKHIGSAQPLVSFILLVNIEIPGQNHG